MAMGARCLTGGSRVSGNYFEPTMMVDVTARHAGHERRSVRPGRARLLVHRHRRGDRDGERLDLRPSGERLLVEHQQRARVAHRLEVGGVVINGAGAFRPGNVPFGGSKQSGIGRESIVDTVLEMTEAKTIVINNAL